MASRMAWAAARSASDTAAVSVHTGHAFADLGGRVGHGADDFVVAEA